MGLLERDYVKELCKNSLLGLYTVGLLHGSISARIHLPLISMLKQNQVYIIIRLTNKYFAIKSAYT